MKHVQRIQRANGKVDLYLRKKGLPSIRLTSAEGSAELAAEVEQLIKRHTAPKPIAWSMKAALRAYELESPEFRSLADSTKYIYRLFLKEMDEDLGALSVTTFTPAYVLELRNTWAERGYQAANHRLIILKHVLKPALIAGVLERDPFPLVDQVRRPSTKEEPHVLWPMDVVETVIAYAIEQRQFGLARAVAIARWAGARRGDLVKISRAARKNGRFAFRSGKRGIPVDIEEEPELAYWLDHTPAAQPVSEWQRTRSAAKRRQPVETLRLVFNMRGLPYTESGLGQAVERLVGELHTAGRIDRNDYNLHGLRHTRGVELALAGSTDAMGAAQMGHASPSSFAQYRRQADRIRLSDDASAKLRALKERIGAGRTVGGVTRGVTGV